MTEVEANVLTAIIVAVPTLMTSVAVPIIMFILQARQKRLDLDQQHAREDEIARRVEAVAQLQRSHNDQSRMNTAILVDQNQKMETMHAANSEKMEAIRADVQAIKENGH